MRTLIILWCMKLSQSSSWITNNYMATIKHVLFADLSVCLALEKTNVTRERDSCRDSETEMIRTGVRLKIIVLSDVTISGWGDRNKIRETDLGSIQLMQGLPAGPCDQVSVWSLMCPAVSVCWLTEINSNQEDECGHVTRPDIIVPDVNHLTTSNQELHPVIDPDPNCPLPVLPGAAIHRSGLPNISVKHNCKFLHRGC